MGNTAQPRRWFPLFADVTGKEFFFAGGGKIAERRIRTCLEFTCGITVCAPEVTPFLAELAEQGKITLLSREAEEADILGHRWFAVIAATDRREINRRIGELCRENGIFVSVADCQEECNFHFPAVALGETITAGITGNGSDHRQVRKISQQIRELIANENTSGQP